MLGRSAHQRRFTAGHLFTGGGDGAAFDSLVDQGCRTGGDCAMAQRHPSSQQAQCSLMSLGLTELLTPRKRKQPNPRSSWKPKGTPDYKLLTGILTRVALTQELTATT